MDLNLSRYIGRREAALAKVRRMLIASLDLRRELDEIDPDTSLFGTGLGIDSVDAVEIVVALETEFGMTLQEPLGRHLGLRSVNTLVDMVLEHEEARHAAS